MTAPNSTAPESTNGTPPAAIARRAGLSVGELAKVLPTPDEVATQAQALRAASVAAISEADVNTMMAAVIQKAREGDLKSVKLVLDHLAAQRPDPRPVPPPQQPARVVVHEPDPPRPVALDGPGLEQHRRLLAFVLLAHQPMSVAGLGQQTGLAGEQLDAALNHEWFARQNGSVRLTPAGRNAVG